MKQLLIIGSGGHARPVVEIAILNKLNIAGIIDLNFKDQIESVLDIPILGGPDHIKDFSLEHTCFFIAIGDTALRTNWTKKIEQIGGEVISLTHPSSIISPYASINKGTLVCAGAILSTNVRIGKGCIINTGVIIDHESTVADFSHLAPGVKIAGRVNIEKNCFIGIGTSIIDKIKIEENVIIGAGSTIIKDIEANSKVIGVSKTIE